MYTLEFHFPQDKDTMYCDMLVHSANTTLLLKGIYASQNTHKSLILHDARDVTTALLLLNSDPAYTVKIASKHTI